MSPESKRILKIIGLILLIVVIINILLNIYVTWQLSNELLNPSSF